MFRKLTSQCWKRFVGSIKFYVNFSRQAVSSHKLRRYATFAGAVLVFGVGFQNCVPGFRPSSSSTNINTNAPQVAYIDQSQTTAVLTGLDKILADKVAASNLVGCTAATNHADVRWKGAAGVVDLATKLPLKPDSLVRIASMTKSFVAALAMLLVQDGKINLEAPVSTYLPDVHGTSQYTVRQLLAQRTGLEAYQSTPNFFDHIQETQTPLALVSLVQDLPLAFTPGEAFAYSNTNFILLGMVIEAATGLKVENLLRTRIYPAAGLTRTWLAGRETVPEALAHGYSVRFNSLGQPVSGDLPGVYEDATNAINPSITWTTGGLVSTPEQVVSFFSNLVAGKIVSPASAAEMMSSPDAGNISSYGLGLWRYGGPTTFLWGHSGDTAGYLGFAVATADAKTVIAVTCNDDHAPNAPREIVEALGAYLTGM